MSAGQEKGRAAQWRAELTAFIRSAVEQNGWRGAVVGISGGLDSAVSAALSVEALGPQRVLGVLLPERDSAPEMLRDGLLVCDRLGIRPLVRPITRLLRAAGAYRLQPRTFFIPRAVQERYVRAKWEAMKRDDVYLQDLREEGDEEFLKALAYYRIKHRLRMAQLYLEAEQRGYAVIGTTNRTEKAVGFYVKWGDEAADIDPLLRLYKTEVFELAEALGVPERIRAKAPSPDLLPGVTDEFALGMSYEELDGILMALEAGSDLSGADPRKVQKVRRLLAAAPRRALRNLAPPQ